MRTMCHVTAFGFMAPAIHFGPCSASGRHPAAETLGPDFEPITDATLGWHMLLR